MKQHSAGLHILAFFVVIAGLPHLQAQTVAHNARPMSYDAAREVTIPATVSTVQAHAGPGMIPGSHLLLATSYGVVDASLGRFGLQGNTITAGQRIEVTGVMKTVKNKPLLLVRTVKVGDAVYAIRDEHGVVLPPQGGHRAPQPVGQKGESL